MPAPISFPERLDLLRQQRPDLGFAIYAYLPGGPVTFEIIDADGQTYQFLGATMSEAVLSAFPEADVAIPITEPDRPDPPAADEPSIFD